MTDQLVFEVSGITTVPDRGVREGQTRALPALTPPTMPAVPRARRTDPATSKIAARAMRPGRHYYRILHAITRLGPANYTEIAIACMLPPVAVNRRLAELRRFGLVVRLDGTRPTPSGRPAYLYGLPGA